MLVLRDFDPPRLAPYLLSSLPCRRDVETWYYFLVLVFLDNFGVKNEKKLAITL
jgi:hypothetical protein